MERKHAVGIPLERLADWDPEIEEHLRCTMNGAFKQALGEVVAALERAGLEYALMGGIASTGLGRPRWTHDIDVFVRPTGADPALDALAEAGFDTERTDPTWLFKAFKHGVLVDVIFRSTGGFYLDDEMVARSVEREFMGHRVRLIAPEDLLVIKAAVHDEQGPRHWHDALGVIGVNGLDWDYLLRRARQAPRRVLSLLVYAHSLDMAVPNHVVRELFQEIYES
jgi:predicted nucleotidyltransferase